MHYGNPPLFLAIQGITQRLDPARTYTVGRDPQSDVVFQEAIVSRRHARIYWGGTSWVLQDLNSTNGTYDLGRRISLAEVGHGASFTLGDATEGPRLQEMLRSFELNSVRRSRPATTPPDDQLQPIYATLSAAWQAAFRQVCRSQHRPSR
ncbi:FHA domain-containing protein [Streptomyces sp. NPDC005728]|uniref:FHA domain-containing protein n=1 Tax=Streptomyces sp. NPDC005728 TaxID=3157054 RepID=UPI0033E26C26